MLVQILQRSGFEPVLSPYLYGDENGYAGTARQRADALMDFYRDDTIEEIFDVSGGDMANENSALSGFPDLLLMRKSISGGTVILPPF